MDTNGNGTVEAGESPLAGVRVSIRVELDGVRRVATLVDGTRVYSAVTDASGRYQFEGLAGGGTNLRYRFAMPRQGSPMPPNTGRYDADLGSRVSGATVDSGLNFPMGSNVAPLEIRLSNSARLTPYPQVGWDPRPGTLRAVYGDGSAVRDTAGDPITLEYTAPYFEQILTLTNVPRICDQQTFLTGGPDSPFLLQYGGAPAKRVPINLCDRFSESGRYKYFRYTVFEDPAISRRANLAGGIELVRAAGERRIAMEGGT